MICLNPCVRLQAIGMVNDHLVNYFHYHEIS